MALLLLLVGDLWATEPVDPTALPVSTATTATEPGPFRASVDPFVAGTAGETVDVRFTLAIPKGTKLYRDQLGVEVLDAAGLTPGALELPPSVSFMDPFSGAPREVYADRVTLNLKVTIPASAKGRKDMRVQVFWQGCGEGICYVPSAQTFNVPVRVKPAR